MPGTCEYTNSHDKRDFVGVVKDFEMKRLFWISSEANMIIRVFIRRSQRVKVRHW